MEHLRRIRHYGPITYTAWIAVYTAIAALATFSLWSS